MSDWSPSLYSRFEDERTRPARDLLAQVPLTAPRRVVDMGCGPGNSTELLVERWPEAGIVGLDSSPAMLEEARSRVPGARFAAADASSWVAEQPTDLVFANAIYQWVPGHLEVLPRVLASLNSGGCLAVQMPDNLAEPTHRLMGDGATAGSWSARLAGAARDPLPSVRAYYEALKPKASRLDLWRTIYQHPLRDAAAIVEMVRSTGLRPFLDPLSEPERAQFLAIYTAKIAAAYPPLADGSVLLPFPRLFLIAERAAA